MTADVFGWTQRWAQNSGLKLWAAEETGSTNSIAKDDLDLQTRPLLPASGDVSTPSVYLARRQNTGRGRGSHVWTTPASGALLSSWSFAVPRVPQPIFSALAGLALYESVRAVWPEPPFNLKAPNDLFIEDRKTAGILIETIAQGSDIRTVVGLGLNVLESPADVPTATCLARFLSSDELSETSWRGFLEAWRMNLQSAIAAGQNSTLSASACARLEASLNRHPLLKEPVLRVDAQGQLHFASRIIYWHEL